MRLLITVLLASLFSNAFAADFAKIELELDGQAVTWSASAKFDFAKIQGQMMVLATKVVIKPDQEIKSVQLGEFAGSDSRVVLRDQEIILVTGRHQEEIQILDVKGVSHKLRVKVSPTGQYKLIRNCKESDFDFRFAASAENIVVGAYCLKQDDGVLLIMSVHEEVGWGTTSIFEQAGKGERWKQFKISAVNTSDQKGDLAKFEFLVNSKVVNLRMLRKVREANVQKKPNEKPKSLAVGAAFAQLSLTAPTASASSLEPGVFLEYTSQKLVWNLISHVHAVYVVPYSFSSDAQNFYHLIGGVGPQFGEKSRFAFLINYDSLAQDCTAKKVSFKHNQVGLEFMYQSELSGGALIGISVVSAGQIIKGDSQDLFANLSYSWPDASGRSWHSMIQYSQQSLSATTGTYQFSQMLLGGGILL